MNDATKQADNGQVRIGIVGLGAIGQRLLGTFTQHPDVRVTAVHDLNDEITRQTAEKVGARACADHQEMLQGDLVDAVYVAVPPAAHLDVTLDALRAGKHVLCEKPLALNVEQAQTMLDAARKSGLVHAMQLPLYFAPGVREFARQLGVGAAGTPKRAEIRLVFPEWPRAWQQNPWIGRREQGGPIRECTPHMFEVVERTLGRVERVRADVQYPDDGISSETAALGALELHGGLLVDVHLQCHVPRPETVALTVYGDAGTLGLRQWAQPVFSAGADELQPLPLPEGSTPTLATELVSTVRGQGGDLPDFAVGLRLQALQDAWERASQTGGWVRVDDVLAGS